MGRALAAAALAAAAVAVGGCGGGKPVPESQAASNAITDFAKAFGGGDGKKACDLLTPAARTTFLKKSHAVAPTTDCAVAMKRIHDLAGSSVTGPFAAATVSGVKVTGSRPPPRSPRTATRRLCTSRSRAARGS